MANLTSLSQLNDSERGRAALGILLSEAPMVQYVDRVSAFEEDATDFDYRPVDGDETVQVRALGAGYTPTATTPESKITGTLANHGSALTIDISHLSDAQRNLRDINAWLDKKLPREVKSWAKGYNNLLFNGLGTGGNIKGLAKIFDGTTDLPGFTGHKGTIDATDFAGSADSLDLTDSANWPGFIRLMHAAFAQVDDPTGIHMNREMYGIMQNIATEYHIKGESRDQFGKPVDTFNGIPMIRQLDGAIPNDEPDNAGTPATECTSLYITGLAELKGAIVTNSGLYWKDFDVLEAINSGEFLWEIRSKWKFEEKNALIRVMKLKATS